MARQAMGIEPSPTEETGDGAAGAFLRALLGDLFIDRSSLSEFQELGEGGFATVHSATLTHRNGMKQLVAVKRLRPERMQHDDDLKEFIAVCLRISVPIRCRSPIRSHMRFITA
jgi:hypothetical protein